MSKERERFADSSSAEHRIEDSIIGSSEAMRELRSSILRTATLPTPILLQGETGVGKKLAARALHHYSKRSKNSFVNVDCEIVSDIGGAEEIFGSCSGDSEQAGMLEAAWGGTLFLGSLSHLSPELQIRLACFADNSETLRLGAVKPRSMDVRLICSTQEDLAQLCRQNRFRKDLFYRLNVVCLKIPPLREHIEDIPELSTYFMSSICQRHQRELPEISAAGIQKLIDHDWPGNVRELESVLEHALIFQHSSDVIHADDLHLVDMQTDMQHSIMPQKSTPKLAIIQKKPEISEGELSLEEYFQRFVLEHQDSMSETELAKKLGISRKCLWERRNRFDLPRKNTTVQKS